MLVRMCGSWEKFMVDLRSSVTLFSNKVKRSGCTYGATHTTCTHAEMFSCIETCLVGCRLA